MHECTSSRALKMLPTKESDANYWGPTKQHLFWCRATRGNGKWGLAKSLFDRLLHFINRTHSNPSRPRASILSPRLSLGQTEHPFIPQQYSKSAKFSTSSQSYKRFIPFKHNPLFVLFNNLTLPHLFFSFTTQTFHWSWDTANTQQQLFIHKPKKKKKKTRLKKNLFCSLSILNIYI